MTYREIYQMKKKAEVPVDDPHQDYQKHPTNRYALADYYEKLGMPKLPKEDYRVSWSLPFQINNSARFRDSLKTMRNTANTRRMYNLMRERGFAGLFSVPNEPDPALSTQKDREAYNNVIKRMEGQIRDIVNQGNILGAQRYKAYVNGQDPKSVKIKPLKFDNPEMQHLFNEYQKTDKEVPFAKNTRSYRYSAPKTIPS